MFIEKKQFDAICYEAGLTIEDVRDCVKLETNEGYIVDPRHRVFPLKVTKGLGDHVAAGLAAVGITKERVSKLVGRDCGCAKRQAALNAIGRKVTNFLRGTDGKELDDQTH